MIDKDELLFVVDENNNSIEPKPRAEVHAKGYWHRASNIWIINKNKQVLCQKRSMRKDTNPGKWEAHFGGHLAPGEDYLINAIKETNEELGLEVSASELKLFKVYKSEDDKEFQAVYYLEWNGDANSLTLEKEEVDEVKWFNVSDLEKLFVQKRYPEWVTHGYEDEMLLALKKDSLDISNNRLQS